MTEVCRYELGWPQADKCPALCRHCQERGVVESYDRHTGLSDAEPCACWRGQIEAGESAEMFSCEEG